MFEHLIELREGEGALIVTHGGVPELAAVSHSTGPEGESWGGPLRCLEGAKIRFHGEAASSVEVLRVPDESTRL